MTDYYIPTLDQFVDGFQYEFHAMTFNTSIAVFNGDEPMKVYDIPEKYHVKWWHKEIYVKADIWGRSLESIKECLERGQIRVKKQILFVDPIISCIFES